MQAMDHEAEPAICLIQLPDSYTGEVVYTRKRLFRKDTPCTLELPDGRQAICFYQGGAGHRRFADGWPAVSEALDLRPRDIVQLEQLAAGATSFSLIKVPPEAAAAAGFQVRPMSETERVRRATTISEDGTVSIPLTQAALSRGSPGIAPVVLQHWDVEAEKLCTLVLPSGAQHERSVCRRLPATNGTIKGWGTAVAELQLQPDEVVHIQMLQQQPLQLRVFTDRAAAAAAAATQQGGDSTAAATATAAAGYVSAAGEPAAAGTAPPPAEAATWQQWVALGWRGSQLVIPERRHLFPAGSCSRRACTLMLPDGLEVACFGVAVNADIRLTEGFAAVADALQLAPGDLLQFSQDAAGSRRFHIQKLPPAAAIIPPLRDYLAEKRQRGSKATTLEDGTIRWPMAASACQGGRSMHIPADAMDAWEIATAVKAVFQLTDGRRWVRTISVSSQGSSGDVCGWSEIANVLQAEPGDLMHMRASQLQPLELQLYLITADGVLKQLAAAEQQAAAQHQQQPTEAADIQVWLSREWKGRTLPLPDDFQRFVPPTEGPRPRRPCTLVLQPSGTEVECFYHRPRISAIDAVTTAMQLAPGDLLQLRQEAPGSRRFHLQKLPPSEATIAPPADTLAAARERMRTVFLLPNDTAQWVVAPSAIHRLHIPAEALAAWGVQHDTDCTLVLSGESSKPCRLAANIKGGTTSKADWDVMAEELELQAGDVLHMRAASLEPLRLHVTASHCSSFTKVCNAFIFAAFDASFAGCHMSA